MNRRILIIIILTAGCLSQVYTEEEAVQIAEDYIRNAPTFKYDGIRRTLAVTGVEPLECEGCFEVTVEFSSKYPGYGIRDPYFLIQKVTPHIAKVRVERGEVTQAILDEIWDEMAQESIVE
ncbi:MAG: hypothetical protein HXS48_25850 [Theionarchaea archaeon]|nr:MAG: hypothetical protein AYK19_13750 [Theionarchaea archaeon DG-70-1]MBU7030382.1 hypothetical protein [Theionarchaea archaeon]